jgi:phage baseplate assembly protein W
MSTVETPHFSFPFRFVTNPATGNLEAAVTEQESADEVADCVQRIAQTRRGWRDELPEFGLSDPTFEQAPVDADLLTEELREWEPRTDLTGVARIDSLDEFISIVRFDSDPADKGEQ